MAHRIEKQNKPLPATVRYACVRCLVAYHLPPPRPDGMHPKCEACREYLVRTPEKK